MNKSDEYYIKTADYLKKERGRGGILLKGCCLMLDRSWDFESSNQVIFGKSFAPALLEATFPRRQLFSKNWVNIPVFQMNIPIL